jgi:hypothetical protein
MSLIRPTLDYLQQFAVAHLQKASICSTGEENPVLQKRRASSSVPHPSRINTGSCAPAGVENARVVAEGRGARRRSSGQWPQRCSSWRHRLWRRGVVELEQASASEELEQASASSSPSPPAPWASICGWMARARESTAPRHPSRPACAAASFSTKAPSSSSRRHPRSAQRRREEDANRQRGRRAVAERPGGGGARGESTSG